MKKNQPLSFKYWFLYFCSQKKLAQKEGGYILLVAIAVILGLTGLVALYSKVNDVDRLTATAAGDSTSGFYSAEGALNFRANQLRQKFVNYGQPTGTEPLSPTACLDGNSGNDGTADLACDKVAYKGANANRSDFYTTTYVTERDGGVPVQGTVPNGDAFQGLNMEEYGHSIYALSFKESNLGSAQGKQASAILQMDVKSRIIPMFQFAAFYTEDLEILPGPTMTLSGPVHTNGDLYIDSGNTLTVEGQITTVGDIYARRKNNASQQTAVGDVFIWNAANTPLDLDNAAIGGLPTAAVMDPTLIANNWGSKILVNTNAPVTIPEPSVLDSTGDYHQKADIRIEFTPSPTASGNRNYLDNIPFELTSIDRVTTPGTPVETIFSDDQRRSLRQPVMVGGNLASISTGSDYHICAPDTNINDSQGNSWYSGLSNAEKETVRARLQDFVQAQILLSAKPIPLHELDRDLDQAEDLDDTRFITNAELDAFALVLTVNDSIPTVRNDIKDITIQEVAGLQEYPSGTALANSQRCYIAAPIMEIGRDNDSHDSPFIWHNERENREIRVLQMNFQSMAVWNTDGQYLASGTTLTSTNGLLYPKAPTDANAPANSLQRLGYAAIDDTQQGIVIHATIDSSTFTYTAGQSPYAFAAVQGHQLFGLATSATYSDPTGITFASDQALYIQGDYNNVNYQPAGILADSFTPLSKECLTDDTKAINHETGINCDTGGSYNPNNNESYNKRAASGTTTFNAALLAGTDITVGGAYNGGLENYPRFLENWSGDTWRYRGSFVSIGTPIHVSGNWSYGGDVYTAPNRDWDYDTNFNDSRNLPPLTPRFVFLKQESFIRSFEQ